MEIRGSTKFLILIIALLSWTQVLAEEPDWRKQNADLEEQQANTANTNANTAAVNANTAAAVNATTAIEIVTPTPAPKETAVVPEGSVKCFVVKGAWSNGAWVPDHRVCQYNQSNNEGTAWIDGYWTCTKFSPTGQSQATCTNWDWKPGHWVKNLPNY